METTSRDSCAKKRVEDGTAEIANQPGLCTQGSLDIRHNPSVLVEDLVYTQQEEGLAKTVIEDEISPDDAPEVVWDDTNEEVCIIVFRSLCVV